MAVIHKSLALLVTEFPKDMGLPRQTHKHKKNRDWRHRMKEEEKIRCPGDGLKSKKIEKREDRIINISGEEKYKMEV